MTAAAGRPRPRDGGAGPQASGGSGGSPTRANTVLRGLAVPNFAEDPAWLVRLGVDAERAGFDGYFLWDHLTHSDIGQGLPAVDPWQILALVAAGTSRIRLGPLITPVPRRRPWKLAKEVTTLDLLSGGRVIFGVGLGSPAQGEYGLFGEPTGARTSRRGSRPPARRADPGGGEPEVQSPRG